MTVGGGAAVISMTGRSVAAVMVGMLVLVLLMSGIDERGRFAVVTACHADARHDGAHGLSRNCQRQDEDDECANEAKHRGRL